MQRLTAELIYGFSNTFLHKNFDAPKETPDFHIELWRYVTLPNKYVAIAAPRGHAKSTAITHAFVLALVLFRERKYVLLVSDTEEQAVEFLGDIKRELIENEELIELFKIDRILRDTESNLIVRFKGGDQFRILAKGSNQKVRGRKWRGTRPDAIIGDDLENDEIVMNEERRAKFRHWMYNALLQAGSDNCIFRIVGTILHLDSFLERLMPPMESAATVEEPLKIHSIDTTRAWLSVKYKAHPGLNDFSQLLWPEKFTEERLREIRQLFVDDGNSEGYSQEYLNYPIDESTSYFKRDDLIPIADKFENLEFYAGVDLAISEKDKRAYTAMVVVGVNPYGKLKVVDVRRFRTNDGLKIIDELFSINQRYKPELITIEDENIAKSIGAFLDRAQIERGIFLNIEKITAVADKMKRARSIQARMRAGQVEFDVEAEWYPALAEELLHFPKGKYADQVDALAHIGLTLDKINEARTYKEIEDEDAEDEYNSTYLWDAGSDGRDQICGY